MNKMKTMKEITEALKVAEMYETWMDFIQEDTRKGVQKAWQQFLKRQEKQRLLQQEHYAKVTFDAQYGHTVAGVDEAGRGPLAGPVVTAAVILSADCSELVGLNDSKQLSKEKRQYFSALIQKHAISYSIHFQSVKMIDTLNIYEATKQSMVESVRSLQTTPKIVLVDAMTLPIPIAQVSVVKGDEKSLAIAAASILAKTARDAYMEQLAQEFPQYGFEQHAGYGTKQHVDALKVHGVTAHHRRSFEPIKTMLKG